MTEKINNAIIHHSSSLSTEASEDASLIKKAQVFASHAYALNTILAYRKDWQDFSNWCSTRNIISLPCPIEALILYITHLADLGKKTSTIQRRICAINKQHLLSNLSLNLKDNNFQLVWSGIKRKLGLLKNGKSPLLLKALRDIVKYLDSTNLSDSFGRHDIANMVIRNKALITFGWASAMRRCEIVALNWSDLSFVEEGVLVTIRSSKTDQYGKGQKIAILYGKYENTCPVRNLQKWKLISSSISGEQAAVFTSIGRGDNITSKRLLDRDIARITKKLLLKIGVDPMNFSGHSLRSGFITTAAKHSVPDRVIMKHSRHKSIQMLQVYTRDNSLLQDNATAMVGL
jgi:integrase